MSILWILPEQWKPVAFSISTVTEDSMFFPTERNSLRGGKLSRVRIRDGLVIHFQRNLPGMEWVWATSTAMDEPILSGLTAGQKLRRIVAMDVGCSIRNLT